MIFLKLVLPGPAAQMATTTPAVRVLLGIMTSPLHSEHRERQRTWRKAFPSRIVEQRLVLGSTNLNSTQSLEAEFADEQSQHNDLFFVQGREGLPHVGKVTEKSASWWQTIAVREPGFSYYCKSDDDTMVHLNRLGEVLDQVEQTLPGRAVYFGHAKWRGWEGGHRFQACGGGWGPADKTMTDMLQGTLQHNGGRSNVCEHASGPYPYMSGGMVCMSRPLALLLSRDAAFADFLNVARERNTAGVPCHAPLQCAAQPFETHMWHHEDAGIGFNVFRAAVLANATVAYVPVTGHYNDAGIVERTPSPNDNYWSARALFAHGVKAAPQFAKLRRRWSVERPTATTLRLGCYPCTHNGYNVHQGGWSYARLNCNRPATGRMCSVAVDRHFTCCGWPWLLPEIRTLILEALALSPERRLTLRAIYKHMGTQARPIRRKVAAEAVAASLYFTSK